MTCSLSKFGFDFYLKSTISSGLKIKAILTSTANTWNHHSFIVREECPLDAYVKKLTNSKIHESGVKKTYLGLTMYMRQLSVKYCKWSLKLLCCTWFGREKQVRELAPYTLPLVPQITVIKAFHLNFLTKEASLWNFSQVRRSNRRARGGRRLQVYCTFKTFPIVTSDNLFHLYIYLSFCCLRKEKQSKGYAY